MSWKGVITNAGNALLAQWAGGSETLYVTGATVGSGYVADVNMRTQTALQSTKDTASIAENADAGNGARRLRVRVGPHATTAYTAHEIGIWAKLGANGTSTLLSLHQDTDDGVSVPTASQSAEFMFDIICVLSFSNSGSLSITVDTAVYASMNDLEEGLEQIAPAYSSSATYPVGAYCIHDKQLHISNVAITTAEAWNSAHWTQITAGEALQNRTVPLYDCGEIELDGNMEDAIDAAFMYLKNNKVFANDNLFIAFDFIFTHVNGSAHYRYRVSAVKFKTNNGPVCYFIVNRGDYSVEGFWSDDLINHSHKAYCKDLINAENAATVHRSGTTAANAVPKGNYIIDQSNNMNVVLRRATDNIAIGDTISSKTTSISNNKGLLNDIADRIEALVSGKKDVQTAKTSPTASGSAAAFIDAVSQDTNGDITATKKNVYASDVQMSDSDTTKISEAIANIKTNVNGGSFSSKATLDSLFDTLLSSMASDERKAVKINCTSGFDVFVTNGTYDCTINKFGTSTNYSTCLIQQVGSNVVIIGYKTSGTWSYDGLNETTYKNGDVIEVGSPLIMRINNSGDTAFVDVPVFKAVTSNASFTLNYTAPSSMYKYDGSSITVTSATCSAERRSGKVIRIKITNISTTANTIVSAAFSAALTVTISL